jgi:NAD(P)H-hydrate epimerase
VVDADGLTALSPWSVNGPAVADDNGGAGESPAFQSDELAALRSLPLILTPHEGEFKRLLGVEGDEANEVLKDRVQAVRDFATRFNVILVLKGERALIAAPDGRVVVNPTGNSGLGKAGNGDTLTGIITGFVAQATQMNIDIFETVVAAVYIAGMAGDVAEKKYGKRVMTASDVRDCLVEVFEELSKD